MNCGNMGAEEAADLLWSRSGIEQWLLVQVGEQFGEHMCHAIQPAGTECPTEALECCRLHCGVVAGCLHCGVYSNARTWVARLACRLH